jgi:hypothetical protein
MYLKKEEKTYQGLETRRLEPLLSSPSLAPSLACVSLCGPSLACVGLCGPSLAFVGLRWLS